MIGHMFKVGSSVVDGNVVAQYTLDGTTRDRKGGTAGALVGSAGYVGVPSVNLGGKDWFQATGAGQSVTFPATPFQRATGTIEFILNYQDAGAGGFNYWRVSTGGTNRRSELYIFAGTLYYYSDFIGNNTPLLAVTVNTSYYVALTWDTTSIDVYCTALPTYPTTSLLTANSPRFDLVSIAFATFIPTAAQADADPDGKAKRLVVSQIKRTRFPTI